MDALLFAMLCPLKGQALLERMQGHRQVKNTPARKGNSTTRRYGLVSRSLCRAAFFSANCKGNMAAGRPKCKR
jgi:hypothetical protein